jgi:hypothetical protein
MKPGTEPRKPDALEDALVSGSNASALSAVALSACSKIEEDSAAGALNGPSQWVWGEREAYTRRATLKHTVVGYAIHHATSILWAAFYEQCFGRSRGRELEASSTARVVAEAAVTASIAYFVDYHVTPQRFRPGFKKHLGSCSIFVSYAAFAAGLALTTLLRRQRAAAQSNRAR